MKKMIAGKLIEALKSVLPVSLIVIILSFIPIFGIKIEMTLTFIVCSIFLILGISLFSLGSQTAMTEMGDKIGSSLIKSKKIWLSLVICLIMGVLITIAEPDLTVLAEQTVSLFGSKMKLIYLVAGGVGFFLVLGIFKIILKKDLSPMLMFFYLVLFALGAVVITNGNGDLLPLAFDSGGVTTGPVSVPFLMAIGVGISMSIGGRDQKENSFGLVSLCSIGPIIAVLILCIGASVKTPEIATYTSDGNVFDNLLFYLVANLKDVGIAIGLIVFFFIVIDLIFIHLSFKKLLHMGLGIIFTYVGLVIFLTAVQLGYMPLGYQLGLKMAEIDPNVLMIFGFVIGAVVVLAEPAIVVLTHQVEDITTGGVSKRSLLIALSIGVGLAIGLSMVRIIFKISLLYFIIPGYIISLGLSFFVPKIYTAIAFDSGGVASGPLTSSFILPFAIGVAMTVNGPEGILQYGFGIVAMVAMAPLIAIQVLGFKDVLFKHVRRRNRAKKLSDVSDGQIIVFD